MMRPPAATSRTRAATAAPLLMLLLITAAPPPAAADWASTGPLRRLAGGGALAGNMGGSSLAWKPRLPLLPQPSLLPVSAGPATTNDGSTATAVLTCSYVPETQECAVSPGEGPGPGLRGWSQAATVKGIHIHVHCL